MVQEEKEEKRVVAKEKPLGGTKVVEETEMKQVREQPPTSHGRAEKVAGMSGQIIGKGLKKVTSVVGEFTSGLSKEMKPSEHHKQVEVQGPRQTEYRSEQREQTEVIPETKVTEKETVEKKVMKETK